jgi:Xaa-Pro aminopeptidase
MLALGVQGLFMPHGLGHQIGLDVHDMEDLGEKYVGYRDGLERSTQLGLKSLRLAKELEAGFVLTVEPGIYFIPELIDKWKAENKFTDFVNYSKLDSYRDFGGVRIEDNCLVTETGSKTLGKPIPKTVEEVEALRG